MHPGKASSFRHKIQAKKQQQRQRRRRRQQQQQQQAHTKITSKASLTGNGFTSPFTDPETLAAAAGLSEEEAEEGGLGPRQEAKRHEEMPADAQ